MILAENIDLIPKQGIANQASTSFPTISKLVTSAVNLLFVLAVVIFFFMLVLGGIRWITSGGDKGQTESAKGQITSAIVGLVIVLGTYAIIRLIETFFGVKILSGLDISPQ
ncbi:MAG: hypothetical protein BMS9Abin21_238 [Thermodesulfovibrionia bacterium]|nr:MAG: hypothetical protein BMS9Abin21_238 [Thermodesulfovibrionia bacterium]